MAFPVNTLSGVAETKFPPRPINIFTCLLDMASMASTASNPCSLGAVKL